MLPKIIRPTGQKSLGSLRTNNSSSHQTQISDLDEWEGRGRWWGQGVATYALCRAYIYQIRLHFPHFYTKFETLFNLKFWTYISKIEVLDIFRKCTLFTLYENDLASSDQFFFVPIYIKFETFLNLKFWTYISQTEIIKMPKTDFFYPL